MLVLTHHLVLTFCFEVLCNALATVAHLNRSVLLRANPNLFAGVLPWHRVAASVPVHERIPRHLARLLIRIRVRRLTCDRVHVGSFRFPTAAHSFMCCAMNAFVRHCPDPLL